MTDAGTMFRSAPLNRAIGDYNKVTKVANQSVSFTGSFNAAAGIIVQATDVTCSLSNGGTILGAALTAKTLYPLGVSHVETGASGVVYVLHK